MKVAAEMLDTWAEAAERVSHHLLHVSDFLRRSGAPPDVVNELENARST